MYSKEHIKNKYREYIRKYVGLLGGSIPDTSADTSLFIRGLERERIDIPLMLDICSSLDIEPIICNIYIGASDGCTDEGRIQIRFRQRLTQWIKEKINSELDGG